VKILITGSNGFLAKNLIFNLKEINNIELILFSKKNSLNQLKSKLKKADFIFHLAGVNRPDDKEEFISGNKGLTDFITKTLIELNKKTPLLFSSSIQVELNNDYGNSKKEAEKIIKDYSNFTGAPIFIYRLTNIFGKWSKPNYNSVIATWCHNIANDKPIKVDNPNSELSLVYVDDVIKSFIEKISFNKKIETQSSHLYEIDRVYKKSLKDIKNLLMSFKESRKSLLVEKVGSGFERALYSTFLSYLPIDNFTYELKGYSDTRGTFYEIIRTIDSGQFSVSTSAPGVTRGNHYHHSKNEKFLVVKGEALIELRHIVNNEKISYNVNDKKMIVIEMIPGYTHKITNIGNDEMILLLWANECFDDNEPDTFQLEV